MRILFVLPGPVRIPMGGASVVYTHAGHLAERGHRVTVVTPRRGEGVRGRLMGAAVAVRDRWHGVAQQRSYARDEVETVEIRGPDELDLAPYDAVIATGHQTAPWIQKAAKGRRSGLVYFLQHDERYLSAYAEATWTLPFTRIAVSQWLADTLAAHGAPVAAVVPNAIDPSRFLVSRPIQGREPRVVALYHRLAVKGPDTLRDALHCLRDLRPEVRADVFAARPPRHRLPEWVRIHVRPSSSALVDLYNRASICLHTSRLEGWGLVPMEAAACGCAVVATSSRGVAEYLRAGESMLEVPVGDSVALAHACNILLEDEVQRERIARAGVEDVSRFSWEASVDRFEQALFASQATEP